MKGTIISFEQAKIKRELSKIHRAHLLHRIANSSQERYAQSLREVSAIIKHAYKKQYQEDFSNEYALLLKNLETKHSKFKFPTTLSNYKKDINPVDALYQNLQEALFKYNKENSIYVWVINLFKNKIWLNDLLIALKDDCDKITEFQYKHFKNEYSIGFDEIHILQNTKSNYQHYMEVFSTMSDYHLCLVL